MPCRSSVTILLLLIAKLEMIVQSVHFWYFEFILAVTQYYSKVPSYCRNTSKFRGIWPVKVHFNKWCFTWEYSMITSITMLTQINRMTLNHGIIKSIATLRQIHMITLNYWSIKFISIKPRPQMTGAKVGYLNFQRFATPNAWSTPYWAKTNCNFALLIYIVICAKI